MLLLIHTLLCLCLLFSAWCRLVKMHEKTTYLPVRLAFIATAQAATALAVAPWGSCLWPHWFPAYSPHWAVVGLMGAFFSLQYATSIYWRHGVPLQYVKENP